MREKLLLDMLTYRRPSDSKTERHWVRSFIATVPGMKRDSYGNCYMVIGDNPTTMISCHTDTVHNTGGRQKTTLVNGLVSLANSSREKKRNCLGADDGAGVFVALEMIRAEVPALYVFHRSEEVGGKGSDYISTRTPELVSGIERCIAFDRRGRHDLITHQMFGRCCSEQFAERFAELLDMDHISASGTFTDSANYTDLIGECTNISVGYESEHSVNETLDLNYLDELIDRLSVIDLDSLPSVRLPGESDPEEFDFGWSGSNTSLLLEDALVEMTDEEYDRYQNDLIDKGFVF